MIEQFYGWCQGHNVDPRAQFASQKERFTADFYSDLQRGFALHPDSGRFLDFDPFSDSQLGGFGFRVEGCRASRPDQQTARVAVLVGLNCRFASNQMLDYVLVYRKQGWQIDDFCYPGNEGLSLRDLLCDLLDVSR